MLTFDINELALEEMRAEDGSLAYKLDFPVYAAKGSRDTSVVYFEIETGASLGMHTDSSEEVVLILQGTGEGVVGGKTAHLPQGRAVVVPAMVPHHITNTGDGWRVSLVRAWGRRRRYPSR